MRPATVWFTAPVADGGRRADRHGTPAGASTAGSSAASASGSVPGRRGSGRASTRDHLLDVAARLFADAGYPDTTVPDIVKAAGIGHGTFYEYFGSRRDILLAITERAGQVNARRPAAPAEGETTLEDRVRAEVRWYLANYVDHLTLSRIWHAASAFDPDVAELVAEARRARTAEVVASLARDGIGDPVARPVIAAAITALLEEFAHRWFSDGEGVGSGPAEVDAIADVVADLLLGGLSGVAR